MSDLHHARNDFSPELMRTRALEPERASVSADAGGPGQEPRLLHRAITTAMQAAAPEGHHRFAVGACLGMGASGTVFAIADENLQRTVAVKIIVPEAAGDVEAIAHLVAEARLTASLAHPNVLPVYDLDVDAQGRTYFSMKRVEGRSLGDVIQSSTPQRREAPIASSSRLVSIFIGVAQALAYAHRQSIVHQDVKPDNIMLGSYGEVLVVDWGSAVRLTPGMRPRLYGTPLYMSPEQARSESVDIRSDVYCLGATLFHALFLRPPTYCEDGERFWQMKRQGVIEAPSALERQQAPAALLSIALRALAVDPAQRYPDADKLLQDLQAFQAGLAVSAHRDSMLQRLLRWHRRHGRRLWVALLVAVLAFTILVLVYGQRVEELASWGRPQVTEDFHDDSWKQHWKPMSGSFRSGAGGIVAQSIHDNVLILDRRFSGPTAIEFDAESLPGNPVCDLTAIWSPGVDFTADRTAVTELHNPYFLQFGAFDGTLSVISRGYSRQIISSSMVRPLPGRTYHVRAQIADDRIELLVDGRLICSSTEEFSFNSGYLGILAVYPGKVFRNIRIFSRGTPTKVLATAIGDAFVQSGDLANAASQYERVAESHPDSALGREATFKQGLCSYRGGDPDAAFAIWKPLRSSEYAGLITLQDIDRMYRRGCYDQVLDAMRGLYASGDAALRTRIALAWGTDVLALDANTLKRQLAQFMDFHDQVLRHEVVEDGNAVTILGRLRRYQDIVSQYPDQREMVAGAYLHLHDLEKIISGYPDIIEFYEIAACSLGLYDKINDTLYPQDAALALLESGRLAELQRRYPDDPTTHARVLAYAGRTDEALGVKNLSDFDRAKIQVNAGKFAELDPKNYFVYMLYGGKYEITQTDGPNWCRVITANVLGLRAWRQGDLAAADTCFRKAAPYLYPSLYYQPDPDVSGVMFSYFAVALLHAGHGGNFETDCRSAQAKVGRRWMQRISYQARYLLGDITDAQFLAQPYQLYVEAELALMRALKADHEGRTAQAKSAYQEWLAIPQYRRSEVPDQAWNDFAAWRLIQLSSP